LVFATEGVPSSKTSETSKSDEKSAKRLPNGAQIHEKTLPVTSWKNVPKKTSKKGRKDAKKFPTTGNPNPLPPKPPHVKGLRPDIKNVHRLKALSVIDKNAHLDLQVPVG